MRAFLSLIALTFFMSTSAQVIKVYGNGTLEDTYTYSKEHKYKIVMEEYVDPHLSTGYFTVGAGADGQPGTSDDKRVKFAKSNLYWDGSAFKFEASPIDYPTTMDATHVGHFFWTNLTDYQSGTAAYMPYQSTFASGEMSTSDKFFLAEDNKITVEGTPGLYALSDAEWEYLIKSRPNASSLYKSRVSISDYSTDHIIIAPDGFKGTLSDHYNTVDDVNSLGLICLPYAGHRETGSSEISYPKDSGKYWTSTPTDPAYRDRAYIFQFIDSTGKWLLTKYDRNIGCSIRLVQ